MNCQLSFVSLWRALLSSLNHMSDRAHFAKLYDPHKQNHMQEIRQFNYKKKTPVLVLRVTGNFPNSPF